MLNNICRSYVKFDGLEGTCFAIAIERHHIHVHCENWTPIVFAHADVTPPVGPPYWITASGLYQLLPCKLAMFSNKFINLGKRNFSLGFRLHSWNIQLFVFLIKTKMNIMWKPQKTNSNIAVLTRERWINPESYTPEREITLADLTGKQCRGNTLYVHVNT